MTHMNRSSFKTVMVASPAYAALSTPVITTPATAVDRHVGAAEAHGVYNQAILVGSGILVGAVFAGRIARDHGLSTVGFIPCSIFGLICEVRARRSC
jgi:hypothetical protein